MWKLWETEKENLWRDLYLKTAGNHSAIIECEYCFPLLYQIFQIVPLAKIKQMLEVQILKV